MEKTLQDQEGMCGGCLEHSWVMEGRTKGEVYLFLSGQPSEGNTNWALEGGWRAFQTRMPSISAGELTQNPHVPGNS